MIKKSGALCFSILPLSIAASKLIQYVYRSKAAAERRQPCSKLSPLCRHCVCLWMAHTKRRRSNHGTIFTSNATLKHIWSDLIPGMYMKHTAVVANNPVAHTYHWHACVPLFDLRRPWDIKATSSRRGTLFARIILKNRTHSDFRNSGPMIGQHLRN